MLVRKLEWGNPRHGDSGTRESDTGGDVWRERERDIEMESGIA